MTTRITRRDFLQKSMAGAGLTLAVSITPWGYQVFKAEAAGPAKTDLFSPSVWLHIAPDNIVTIMVNKSEMGQGVDTALPMIVADELDADWQQIKVETALAGKKYVDPQWGMQLTGGSTSVRHMFEPLSRAGAAAREMLIEAAARTWKVEPSQCVAHKGRIGQKSGAETMSYGQLAAAAAQLSVPDHPRQKSPQQYTFIGHSLQRLDVPPKVHTKAVFGIDASIPGMVYADIARPPAFGAKAKGYDKAAAMKISGVQQVVEVDHGIAVTADSITAAWQGKTALKVQWSQGSHPHLDSKSVKNNFLKQLDQPGKRAKTTGNVKQAMKAAHKKVRATYVLPYLAHACMEPMNCTAHVTTDRCIVWAPTQNQTGALKAAERISGLGPEKIQVHTTYLGGGFGRRGETDYVEEVLQLSKAVGKPVKLIWTRPDDIQHGFFRPGNSARIEGALDRRGNLTAWSHKVVCPPIGMANESGDIARNAIDGIANQYAIANLEITYRDVGLPVPTGYWRSVGNSQNGFTVESFMDELAHAANQDPLEFRLQLLKNNQPAKHLLEVLAEKSAWGKGAGKGEALGPAYHYSFGTHVAQVADVSIDKKDGTIRVHKIFAAVDCGPQVNPATIVSQITGASTMGLSAALRESVEFAEGGVQSANFYNYHLLRMKEAPEVEVHLVKGQGSRGGIGEPGLPPTAPAVANAVFRATGVRIRELPMQSPKIRQKLQQT